MTLTRAESRRISRGARIFAAWLALSVVFALTPCCDIYAAFMPDAPHAAVPDHTAVAPGRNGGDDQPCAAWLDGNDALPAEAGFLPSAPPKPVIAVPSAFQPLRSPVAAFPPPFVASASPPETLYLRYQRLIL